MSDIKIIPVNQLKVKLECSGGVNYEIAEHFSFFVPGYKYMPQYKSGRWDGKIKMYDQKTKLFPKGLIPRLLEWVSENGYKVELERKDDLKPKVYFNVEWLKSWQSYSRLKPKPHQVKAIVKCLSLNQALALSPTSSGKSLICYMMVRYLLENADSKILITVPTVGLVEQLYSDFADYASETDWDVSEWCQKIYSGKEKNTGHRIYISTWHSIYKLPQSWFNMFGAYICDEAHGADSKSISSIVEKLSHAPVRIGMTGTLDGSKLHELEMLARFGPLIRVITTAELMESGDVAQLHIRCIRLKYPKEDCKYVKGLDYQHEIDYIVTHDGRNRMLVDLALNEPKNTLMLFNYIDKHGVSLYNALKEKADHYGKKVYYIAGSVDVDERERIRQVLEKENNAILLASMGTFSTGVSVKNLHTVIFCHPYKARIKTLQSIGRGLRTMAGKEGVTLIDIADDLVHKTKSGKETLNTTMKHFIERLKIYQDEQFKYTIENVELTT